MATDPQLLRRNEQLPPIEQKGALPTVLHYSHHSVGLGHLVRSLAVAGALGERFRVVLCSGGPVPAGLRLPPKVEVVQLPPIGLAPDGRLGSLDRSLTLEEAWRRRRARLLTLYRELRPVAIVVELFPFGRAKFARELLPLLETARRDGRATVISSVRDILVTAKRDQLAHDSLAAERLRRYFDAVIVHADPRFARLDETFRPPVAPPTPVLYSGFVCSPGEVPLPTRPPRPEVIVSAGGGLSGAPLFRAAVAAHRLRLAGHGLRTRLVTGAFLAASDVAALEVEAASSPGLSVERLLPNLSAELARATASVSQCGYNTALDLLRARVPGVVVPHSEARENEQPERARRLAQLGAVTVLPAAALSPARLADAVLRTIALQPTPVELDLEGASTTAALVAELVERRVERRAA